MNSTVNDNDITRPEWTDPLKNLSILCLDGVEQEHTTKLVAQCFEKKWLSERAIQFVEDYLKMGPKWFREKTVELSHAGVTALLDVVVKMLMQSYNLACSTYDEPQLAIAAIIVLCRYCMIFPQHGKALEQIALFDAQANDRVILQRLQFAMFDGSVIPDRFLRQYLDDFRMLFKRQHFTLAHHYRESLPSIEILVRQWCEQSEDDEVGPTPDQKTEIIYLLAEVYLNGDDYWKVAKIPHIYAGFWSQHHNQLGRIKRCVARAMLAIGDLMGAKRLYQECGVEDLAEIDACLSGSLVYASILATEKVAFGNDLDQFMETRELPNGMIAIFFRNESDRCIEHKLFDPATNSFVDGHVPALDISLKAIKVIPDPTSQPVRLLVGPMSNSNGGKNDEDIDYMMASMFGNLRGLLPDRPAEKIQLWEFQGDEWMEVKTWGSVPDSYEITRPGSHCIVQNDLLVLFVGSQPSNIGNFAAGPFVLDTKTHEWSRAPHPYKSIPAGMPGMSSNDLVTTMPSFSAVFQASIDGRDMIAMIREKREVNPTRNHEITPKFALDFFEVSSGEVAWTRNVPTVDQCGYIATMFSSALPTTSSALVVGTSQFDVVSTALPDGEAKEDPNSRSGRSRLLIAALDLKSFGWRGVNIANSIVLQHMGMYSKLVKSGKGNCCYLVSLGNRGLAVFKISNLSSIEKCFTEPLSHKKRLSKKHTLSYILAKAEKTCTQPLHECASCSVFERSGERFSICARCKEIRYCSRNCQKEHWKIHKQECFKAVD